MKPCAHHWDIEPANGPVSVGICRNCGAVKDFTNTVAYNKNPHMPIHLVNRSNSGMAEDIRIAEFLTRDYTRPQ